VQECQRPQRYEGDDQERYEKLGSQARAGGQAVWLHFGMGRVGTWPVLG
jgi:hypothetical protein